MPGLFSFKYFVGRPVRRCKNADQSQTRQKRSEIYRQSVPRTNKRNFGLSQIFIIDAH